jgi:hypothetical protein
MVATNQNSEAQAATGDEFDRIVASRVVDVGNGQYVRPGYKYRHVIKSIKRITSRAGAKPFVFVTLVPKSAEKAVSFIEHADGSKTEPVPSPLGTETSFGVNLALDAGPSSIKAFFLALVGASEAEFDAMENIDAAAATAAAKPEAERNDADKYAIARPAALAKILAVPELQRTVGQIAELRDLTPKREGAVLMRLACSNAQPFTGFEIDDLAYNKPTRDGNDFTRHTWTHVPAQSQATAAGNAATIQDAAKAAAEGTAPQS